MKKIMSIVITLFMLNPLVANDKSIYISSPEAYIGGQNPNVNRNRPNPPAARQNQNRNQNRVQPRQRQNLQSQYQRYQDKSELALALQLAREQNYVEASRQLFDLSRNPKYRAEREQIRYILGLMLFQMGLYQSAGYQFVSVVRQGSNAYLDRSLERLTIAADLLNDRTLLNYSLSRVELEKFPRSQRDMLRFRVGEFQYQNRQLDKAAHNFSRVGAQSPYFAKAKYMEALSYAERNQLQESINAFNTLRQSRSNASVTDTNRVAAQMGMARVLYQNRNWDRSIEMYREIPRDSPFWHDALFEMSWALMRGAKLRSVLSNFHSLHSPFYEDAYIPESLLLRGIVYLYICQYEEMEKTLDLFQSIYRPMSNNLKKYLASRPRSESIYADLKAIIDNFDKLLKNAEERKKYPIPFAVASKILDQGDIKSTLYYIDQLHNELRKLNSLPADWKASAVGDSSIKLVNRRLRSAERRLGLQIKNHLIEMNRDLDRLIEQHDFARFEMLNAKKEGIKQRIGTVSDNNIDEGVDREFFIKNGFEYWPFQGEYWLDEIGNYHYLGTRSCE